jgi:DNA-binding NarL/FixJ family response regulator
MSNPPIRIILVDDHELVRKSWRKILETKTDLLVVADCDNGNTAIELAGKLVPDIMLVDINMLPLNGFMVTEKVLETVPSVKIIGLSVNIHFNYAIKMIKLGAQGYMTKTSPPEELIHCIREVQKGNLYICEEVKKSIPPSGKMKF